MMDTKKIATDYVDVLKTDFDCTRNLNSALRKFSVQNLILSISDHWIEPYSKLVEECIGEELMEWIDWWIFEGDFGRNAISFYIDKEEYTISNMTFSDFFDAISPED